MNNRSLAERRERLIAQAAAQRTTLARCVEPWRVPMVRVDQGLNLLRAVRRHPAWIVGGVALFVVLRPARVVKWLRRGWVAWGDGAWVARRDISPHPRIRNNEGNDVHDPLLMPRLHPAGPKKTLRPTPSPVPY